MREISWIRAYAGSAVVHLLVVGAAAMFLAGAVMQQEQQQMYVIDLDTSELSSAGSGHAGGGELFPEKLSETAVAERVAQIDASQSAVMPHPQLSDAVPEPAPSSQPAPAAASSSLEKKFSGSLYVSGRHIPPFRPRIISRGTPETISSSTYL